MQLAHPKTFAVLSAALLTFIMQFAMVSVSLNDIIEDLDAPLRWGGWTLTAFLVTQIMSMSLSGRLVERYGATPIFLLGMAGFGVASLACAVAPTFATFIAARAIQGLAGGAIMPSGQAVLGQLHGERDRARAIGLFSSIMPFGAVLGPFLGGLIVEAAGWRWTFAISVPISLVVLLLARAVLPRDGVRTPVRLDIVGSLLLVIAVPALILALTEIGQREVEPDMRLVVGGFVVALITIAVLLRYETKVRAPILDLALLRQAPFLSMTSLAFLFGLAWMGVFTLLPLYVQEAYNMAPAESGALMGPRALVMVLVSSSASFLLARTGFRPPLVLGLVGMGAMLFLLSLGLENPSLLGIGFSSFWWLMLVITTAGFFFGFSNPALNTAGVDLAPHKIATIAGTRGMFMMLGGTIGISLVVMSGSRAAEVSVGMERMFLGLSIVLVLATLLARWAPTHPGPGKPRGEKEPEGARAPSAPAVASGQLARLRRSERLLDR